MDRYRAHDKNGVEIGILDLEEPDTQTAIQWAASVGLLDVRLIEKRIGGDEWKVIFTRVEDPEGGSGEDHARSE
jgi:hypothetical protein